MFHLKESSRYCRVGLRIRNTSKTQMIELTAPFLIIKSTTVLNRS